jgi:hypothetical protein
MFQGLGVANRRYRRLAEAVRVEIDSCAREDR